MEKAKRVLSIFLVVLMLFTSLPMNVFAEEITPVSEESTTQEETTAVSEETTTAETATTEASTTEEVTTTQATTAEETTTEAASEPVYEENKEYTVNGVIYRTYGNYATVIGAGENMPADVVIPEKIGTFIVQKITDGAFDDCKELKSIVIPKTVMEIAGLKNTGLEKAEIHGTVLNIKTGAFRDCPLFENEKNWKNDLLIISNVLIAGRGSEEVYLGKEITTVAGGCFGADSQIPRITFENLKFTYSTMSDDTFGKNTVLRGRVGSDAERYANSFGNPFEYYCTCENTQLVEETKTYCNGTVGYSEGVWCESCGIWLSGHEKDTVFNHMDENEDGICDYCQLSTDEKIIDSGALNQTVFWCRKEDGTVLFFGTGKITRPLSGSYKFVNIVIGGDINEIDSRAFSNFNYLESVVFGENVKTIGQSAFSDCPNLLRVEIEGKYVDIKSGAFSNTPFINNASNYKDGLLIVSGCLVNCKKNGYVFLDKSVNSIAAALFRQNDRIIIENPDCFISDLPSNCSVMALEGSTAEKYAKAKNRTFYRLCLCDDTLFVEGKPSLCDGTLNYRDGQWCEKCNTWKLGYGISAEIQHSETLIDGVCTICGEAVPESDKIIESGVIENGVWILQNESELVIYGKGEIDNPKDEQEIAKWNSLIAGNRVKKVTVKGTVSKIGDSLFSGMTSIESVKLENGITEIGESAFYGCNNLVNIELSNILISVGNSAFKNCKLLQVPVFPDTLYKIGDRAFEGCDAFESVELPDNVEYIGDRAFAGCSNLTYVKLSKKAARCGEYAFYSCVRLKTADLSGFGTVNEGTFEKCSSLETVITSKSNIYVKDNSFADCSSLINIPWEKVRSIGKNAFLRCTSLTEVNLDCSGKISDFAFYNCTKLKKVTMSAQTDYFGVGVFQSCIALEDVTLSTGLTEIPKQMFKYCRALKAIEIPANITSIGVAAFRECGLTEIVLGESVSQIKVKAFYGCSNLESITFLNNAVAIAGIYTEDGKKYPSIPKTTVIYAATGSKAHSFALGNGYAFNSTDDFGEPVKIEVITPPTKSIYYVSEKATKIDTSGIALRVYFENESYIDLTSGFTVDAKDTDLTKAGTYNPVIIYKGLEVSFTVTVLSDGENPDVPPEAEDKILDFVEGSVLNFRSSECKTIRFIPKESRVYYFVLENVSSIYLKLPDNSGTRGYSSDCFSYNFTAGETYLITYNSTSSSHAFRETDIFDSELLSDGTLRLRRYIASEKILTIPSEIDGKKVTVIGENMLCRAYRMVEKLIIEEGITKIESGALMSYRLKEVALPESLVEIGDNAFLMTDLTSIQIPSNVKFIGKSAFMSCPKLAEVDFCEATAIEEIGASAFKYCYKLKEITLPSSMKEIGAEAFAYCLSLETVVFGENEITFGEQVFSGCKELKNVTLPEKQTAISDYMFSSCTSLKEIKLNEGIKKIGERAFAGTRLETVVFPNSLEEIGKRAFWACNVIKEIVIPEKVTVISDYAFDQCSALEKVCVQGENVKIEDSAFAYCSVLREITFENSVSEIGEWAFRYCKALENIDFGNSLTEIGMYAFENCAALTEIILPESLTEIKSNVFAECFSLKKVVIQSNIKTIAFQSFYNCTSLESINIPESVSKIGQGAFENTKIRIESLSFEEPVEIGENAFKGCTGIKSLSVNENSTIGESAFEGNTALGKVNIGDNSTIYGSAFKRCTSLKEFEIAKDTVVFANALDDCRSLKKITILNPMMPVYTLGSLPSNVKIYAIKGSNGEKYANENNFAYYEIQGHAHSFTVVIEGEKKCYTAGKEIYTCECGYSYEKTISSSSHKYKDFETEKEPTCTEPGLKTRHCYCGKTRTDITVLEPLGHTEVIDIPAVAPTSTEPGYTHQSHCSVCGETVVKRELISHSEYDILVDDTTVTAYKFDAATAENDGLDLVITFTMKNNVCMSNIDKTVIYKVGEVKLSKTKFTYNGKVQKPAVTVKDSTGEPLILNRDYKVTYSADSKYCGEYRVRVDYVGNYAGNKTLCYDIVHNWSEGKITKSPTCTKTGVKMFTCGCGESYSETIAKLAHTYDNNCDKTCNVCKATRNVSHSYKIVTTKATLSKNGKVENKCIVCGYVSKTTTVYYPKTIKLSATTYTYNGKVKSPTVTVKDSKGNTLKKDTDYTVSYASDRKNTGKYSVTVAFKGKYSGKKVLYFNILPSKTSKITPTCDTTSIKVGWSKVTGASGYKVELLNSKGKVVKTVTTTKAAYTFKELSKVTTYKIRVTAYKTIDSKKLYSTVSTTITTATAPAKATLSKVTAGSKSATPSWKKVSGASGYEVMYSTSSKFSSSKTAAVSKSSSTKTTIKKLTKGKKYYFKVRAYKTVDSKKVYGAWSAVKSVKVK